eukprot:1158943-Pelagomonas_calceolata.AAC.6
MHIGHLNVQEDCSSAFYVLCTTMNFEDQELALLTVFFARLFPLEALPWLVFFRELISVMAHFVADPAAAQHEETVCPALLQQEERVLTWGKFINTLQVC